MVAKPHGNHNSHPHARKNHTHRQRQFHLKQKLRFREPHASPRFHHSGIDAADSRVGVPDNRQQGIQSERQNRQPVGALAQPRHRQQKSKERKAGNRLNNVGAGQHRLVEARPMGDRNSQRYADQHREQRGKANQPQMLQREFQHLAVILQDESKDVHAVPRFGCRLQTLRQKP